MPSHAILLALLSFNIGVEIGQLLFVAAVISLRGLWLRMAERAMSQAVMPATYAIGGVAAYWTIDRAAGFRG